jgi:hypothetical protein
MLVNKCIFEVQGTLDKLLLGLHFLVPKGALRDSFTSLLKPARLGGP